MTLSETQLVPLAHDVAATYFAELVGGQAADIVEQLEPRHGLGDHTFVEHGVAVDHCNHGTAVRQVTRDGAEAIGQTIALAGARNAYEVQLDALRRVELRPHALDQQLIGHFHQRADDSRRQAAVDGFADNRVVDLCGGQRVDAEAGDHQKHMGRVCCTAQLANLAAQVRVDDVQENHPAYEVRDSHRVAPDTNGTNQEYKVLRL